MAARSTENEKENLFTGSSLRTSTGIETTASPKWSITLLLPGLSLPKDQPSLN